jgi:16S rRNA (cytosine1402-N4)-methyltransferase
MNYHEPVLKAESIAALGIHNEGIYVDATFGGGGHSKAILSSLSGTGRLFGFDQDNDAKSNILDDGNFTFIDSNFRFLKKYLRLHGVRQVDGILADLGVSSHQLDQAERGFSFRFDAELDMRMNQDAELSAKEVIQKYSESELVRIFSAYGEVRNSKTLAQTICSERAFRNIETIQDLVNVMEPVVRGKRNKYLAQVFQAIRIEVNDEMGALEEFLEDCLDILKPGGKLVVISYHSLEDRPVKNFLKSGNFEGKQIKDFYGNIERPFKLITKKAMEPSEEEIKRNRRARSAKMRVAEKK